MRIPRTYDCPACGVEREVTEHRHANTIAHSPTCPNCHTAAAPVETLHVSLHVQGSGSALRLGEYRG